MKKLTKIGVSALCGSLAGISAAHAGDLSVTGGADMTWMSKSDTNVGNPIGMGSNLTFKGSGELDNGWSVDLTVGHKNANAYSNTNVIIGVPGLGDIRIDQGVSGTGIQRMDDLTPSVWEEADGAGLAIGQTKIQGVSAGANIEFTPSSDIVPDGATVRFAWSPDADGSSTTADKGVGGDSGVLASGFDLTVEASDALHGVTGLTVYGGISRVDQHQSSSGIDDDAEEDVIGFKYASGSFTLGWQLNKDDTGNATTNTEYEMTAYGVTFQVNDDLSIGYNHVESEKSSTANVTAEADSIQIAYTMGGASIRLAEVDASDIAYTAGNDKEATILSLGLAF